MDLLCIVDNYFDVVVVVVDNDVSAFIFLANYHYLCSTEDLIS